MTEEMLATVLEEVERYILCRQNNISLYIATHPILELCLEAERHQGLRVTGRWLE